MNENEREREREIAMRRKKKVFLWLYMSLCMYVYTLYNNKMSEKQHIHKQSIMYKGGRSVRHGNGNEMK